MIGWRKNLIRAMMEKQVTLPEAMWARLNAAWAGFFAAMGVLNLYVAYTFSTDAWVNFKLFGSMGLMLVFIVLQSIWLSRHIREDTRTRRPTERPQRTTRDFPAMAADPPPSTRCCARPRPTTLAVRDDSALHAGHAGAASAVAITT